MYAFGSLQDKSLPEFGKDLSSLILFDHKWLHLVLNGFWGDGMW